MRDDARLSPGLAASAVAHLALVAALLLVRPAGGGPSGDPAPVTVRLASAADLAAAQAAASAPPGPPSPATPPPAEAVAPPAPEAAPAPTPVPTPKPAPTPVPTPAPAPRTRPAPATAPTAATGAPRPAAAARTPAPPKPAGGGLDLDALAAQVARLGGGRPGPSPAVAAGPSSAALAGLQDQLQRRWTPNCEVEGGRDVRVRVSFGVTAAGALEGPVEAGGLERSDNPVVRAAAERAIRAVHQAAPFPDIGAAAGRRIAVNFNAREACS